MKSSHRLALAGVLAGSAWLGRAQLAEWAQHIEGAAPAESIFFRTVALPAGAVQERRPPQETIPDLTKALAAAPGRADLLYLRARERESNGDFASAESDWRAYAAAAADKVEGQTALADYFHRRLQPKEELDALLEAAKLPAGGRDAFARPEQQRSWTSFERALALAAAQAMAPDRFRAVYEAWLARYPDQPTVYSRYFDYLVAREQYVPAQALLDRYGKAFAADTAFPLRARTTLEEKRGPAADAIAIYDRAFDPLWPPDLVQSYFQLLERTRSLRTYLANARVALDKNPADLNAAVRIFYYYQQKGDLPQAQRALLEFRARKDAAGSDWTASERLILARLFQATQNYVESARDYVAVYTMPQAPANDAEQALAGLIDVLLTAPEQPIRFGSGDLTYYKDIATMDPYPGALNGILSLLFNTTSPSSEFAGQEQAAVSYFHRARAAELMAELDRRFSSSSRRPALHLRLIQAYAAYGEAEAVIRKGAEFLAAFPKASERVDVALAMADAHARQNDAQKEFAVYDRLLSELAADAQGVPLGQAASSMERQMGERPGQNARLPKYQQVLDRYIARLVSLKQVKQALVIYRRELDRNPNDPGLYEALARFLDQNRLSGEVAAVYARAAKQFDEDRSWYAKLARLYLRTKQNAEFGRITQEVTGVFSGTELDQYFQQVVAGASLDAAYTVN